MREEELAVILSAYGFALPLLGLEPSPYIPVPKRRLVELAETIRVLLRLGRTDYSELVDELIKDGILVEENGLVRFNLEKIRDDPELAELFKRAGDIAMRIIARTQARLAMLASGERDQYVAN